MQTTLFKPVQIPPELMRFPTLINQDMMVTSSLKKGCHRYSLPSVKINEKRPQRSESMGVRRDMRPRLTKENLDRHGLGFLSFEDKNERVYYWIESIEAKGRCFYPYGID